jgi:hypothetical protein
VRRTSSAADRSDVALQVAFPPLFFKRTCDVYDEEFANALEESGGDLDYTAFAGPPLPAPGSESLERRPGA